jgi:hypothetical protein
MKQRVLRCPRCGKPTTIQNGQCTHCGLPVEYSRHSGRQVTRSGSRPSGRLAMAQDKIELEFGVNNVIAQPAAPSGAASRYDLAAGGYREAPAGGDVEVGTMSSMLMDPSDNPNAEAVPAPVKPSGKGGGALELGESGYGADSAAAKAAANNKAEAAAATDSAFEQMADLAPRPSSADQKKYLAAAVNKAQRNRYLLTRVLPQAVLLLIVLFVGPLIVGSRVDLKGAYLVLFQDEQGRKVTCTTKFLADEKDPRQVHGLLECKLYESDTSTARVDEPAVLKPIMANGTISYNGEHDYRQLKLKLGSFDANDRHTVTLEGSFDSGGQSVTGRIDNSLGNSGTFTMTRQAE